jgi:hypothetical protein
LESSCGEDRATPPGFIGQPYLPTADSAIFCLLLRGHELMIGEVLICFYNPDGKWHYHRMFLDRAMTITGYQQFFTGGALRFF